MLELLQSAGNSIDKLRLVLLYLICCDDISSIDEFEKLI
jgi:hypothetical protein